VRRSLIAKLHPAKAAKDLDLPTDKKPDAVVNFDFVLAPQG
jgi:hydroxyquinol 1,2-dioxygenase